MQRTSRFAVFVLLAMAVGCARNPVTGKEQLSLVSEAQEIQMGQQAAKEVAQTIGLVDDKELQAYVSRVGKTLAATTERPKLPWSFAVVDDPSPNAFALPGGFIFVTRGLMADLNSEAELAMVVGHEIGHVTARHSVSQISKAQLAQLGLGIGMILSPTLAAYGQAAGAGMQLLFLKFSRDDESQADGLGFKYAFAHHYDMKQGVRVMDTLDRLSQKSGGGKVPTFLQTHPDPGDRFQVLEKKVAKTGVRDWTPFTRNRPELLAAVDGVIYGENPRNGYVRKDAFIAPDLRIQFRFPAGWKVDNQPTAVTAISPQQDAAISLSIVPEASPEQAAQKFASGQGIEAKAIGQGCERGGSCLAFQAATQQGTFAGYAGFVELNGKTFGITAYAPEKSVEARQRDLLSALSALEPIDDPRALDVQPARVDVVKIEEPMTFMEFAQRYPSTVSLEDLALANGMKPSDRLEPGMLVKRIVGGKPGGGLTGEP